MSDDCQLLHYACLTSVDTALVGFMALHEACLLSSCMSCVCKLFHCCCLLEEQNKNKKTPEYARWLGAGVGGPAAA